MSKGSGRRPGTIPEGAWERVFGDKGDKKLGKLLDDFDAQCAHIESLVQKKRERRQQQVAVDIERRSGQDRRSKASRECQCSDDCTAVDPRFCPDYVRLDDEQTSD